VEGGEESVPGRIDLLAAKANQLPPHELVVTLEQLAPGAGADSRRALGRAADVDEEHRGEHAVRLGLLPPGFPGLGQELLDLVKVRLRVAGERRVVGDGKLDG